MQLYASRYISSNKGIDLTFLTCLYRILQGQGTTQKSEQTNKKRRTQKNQNSHVKVQEINTINS